ncbi:LuxR family transcriptional regulator [Acidothermaceae bacterium B102]|nr:LuxR family transcriptional regulator [Acidothermaceae bacterium B102]
MASFAAAIDDPACRGFSIRGAAGTGKTALAGACLDILAARALPFVRVDATATSAAVPLAAVAHLITPALRDVDPATLFSAVRGRLEARVAEEGSARLVVFVDDVSLLDPTSLALIATVAGSPQLFLITTDRSDRPDPDLLAALWRSGRLVGVDLEGFSRRELDLILHVVLQAPVAAPVAEALWAASDGNPLFVRELVNEALHRDALRQIDGVWQLIGSLLPGPRLMDFVASRVSDLDGEARRLLDRVAVCGPLPLARVVQLVDHDALAALERRGVLSVHSDGALLMVDVAHPLHREALRRLLPVAQAARLLLDEADHVQDGGRLSDAALARVVSWRIAAGAPVEPDLLLRAARMARFSHDFPTVERMIAASAVVDAEAVSLRCEALYQLHRDPEALALAVAVLDDPGAGGAFRGRLVATAMLALSSGLVRSDDAIALAEREIAAGTAAKDEAQAALALLHANAGRTALADELAPTAGPEPRLSVYADLVTANSATGRGQTASAVAAATRAATELRLLGDRSVGLPHPLLADWLLVWALLEGGRVQEAVRAARQVIGDVTITRGQVTPAQTLACLAAALLAQGNVREALDTAMQAVSAGRDDGIKHGRLLGWSVAVQAQVMARDPHAAREAAERMRALPDDGGSYWALARAEAWLAASVGELGQAREQLVTAADLFVGLGQPATAIALLSESVRFGGRGVSERMAELSSSADNPLCTTRVMHARACDAADVDGLIAAAESFAAMGFPVREAECLTLAATLCAATDQARRGRTLALKAAERRASCGDPWTPGLVTVVAHVPLTAREHEIAVLAVAGHSSPAIASKLFLSVRTVSNHLQSVYSKTGANGREELATLIDLTSRVD